MTPAIVAIATTDTTIIGKGKEKAIDATADGESSTTVKPDYNKLPGDDEPLILHYGGKQVRDLLNEVLSEEDGKDYDLRALIKIAVTVDQFRVLFKYARERRLGYYYDWPPWIACRPIQTLPPPKEQGWSKGIERRDSHLLKKSVEMMNEFGNGGLSVLCADAAATELDSFGQRRIKKALGALEQHPSLLYVCAGVVELLVECYKARETLYSLRTAQDSNRRLKRGKNFQEKLKKSDTRFDKLINEMEAAVFSGNFDWFVERYGDDEEEAGFTSEQQLMDKAELSYDLLYKHDMSQATFNQIKCQCGGIYWGDKLGAANRSKGEWW